MTKRILAAVLAAGSLLLLGINVMAAPAGRGFYVCRNRDHKQPVLDEAYQYIEKYDCYYIDKNHGDESEEKVVYLTFDAGYENGNVKKILDTLKKEQVTGAFFVLDHLVRDNTELVKRMAKEGHLVCNHTSHHKDMTRMQDADAFMKELTSLETLYREKIGQDMPQFYRPPEGKISEENLQWLQKAGYKTILWSFAYADWDNQRQMPPEKAKEKIMENIHNGAVLLFHPTSATNAAILGDVIVTLKSQGYRFGTLQELTGEKCDPES